MKFYIETFGCQMNKLDSELIAADPARAGFRETPSPDDADVLLVNTCSVRRHAEERAYSFVGRFKPRRGAKPDKLIGVIGCMAQAERQTILERAPFVSFICGPGEIDRIVDILDDARRSRGGAHLELDRRMAFDRDITRRPRRHSAFVSISRGCNNFCAYCIVPYTRGREQSRSAEAIEQEVRQLVDDGAVEITLLGQNVNSWGADLQGPGTRFAQLLARLDAVDGLKRLRFVTSHPKDLADDLVAAMAQLPSVCPYLHLPAQAGSNRVLAAMNRGYTREHYLDRVDRLRQAVPGMAMASDFIVGFPGETEDDYLRTVDLVQRVRYKNCFIFKYSPRPGTAAAEKLSDDVPRQEKQRRNLHLLNVQEAVSTEDNAAMVGRVVDLLIDGPDKKGGRLTGRTRTDHIVHVEADDSLIGRFARVQLTDSTPLSFQARLLEPDPADAD